MVQLNTVLILVGVGIGILTYRKQIMLQQQLEILGNAQQAEFGALNELEGTVLAVKAFLKNGSDPVVLDAIQVAITNANQNRVAIQRLTVDLEDLVPKVAEPVAVSEPVNPEVF